MNKGDIVKPREFDHKSKMRLIEHGADWRVDSDPSHPRREGIVASVLLTSTLTGYQKWWKLDHIDELEREVENAIE